MLTGHCVEKFLASFNPNNRLNAEEIFLHGNGEQEVCGICVCWMATVPAIAYAIEHHCNLIICHEALTFYDYPLWVSDASDQPWPVDQRRLTLLRSHNISVLRAHSTIDPTHIGPALRESIGLPTPQFQGWAFSQHTVAPVSVADLAARTAEALEMDHVRVTGTLGRIVTNVGMAWGGLGLDRHINSWVKHLLPRGVEALIVGETNDFAQRYATESNVALIETCHSASEDPGLQRLAEDLSAQFPTVEVVFRPGEIPWTTFRQQANE